MGMQGKILFQHTAGYQHVTVTKPGYPSVTGESKAPHISLHFVSSFIAEYIPGITVPEGAVLNGTW